MVDYVRSCYSTACQWFQDGSVGEITWYFVPEDTPDLGVETAFGSRNWDEYHVGWAGVGEVYGAPRPWRNGSYVGDAEGVDFCGDLDQWVNGDPSPPAEPTPTNEVGTPLCCGVQGFCRFCPGGTPQRLVLVATNGVGFFTLLNGTWPMHYIGRCTWKSDQSFQYLDGPDLLTGFWQFRIETQLFRRVQITLPTVTEDDFDYPNFGPWGCNTPFAASFRVLAGAPWLGQPFDLVIYDPLNPVGLGPNCPATGLDGPLSVLIPVDPVPLTFRAVIRPGLYTLTRVAACTWAGTVPVTLASGRFDFTLRVTMTWQNGGTVAIAFDTWLPRSSALYTSSTPWDGASSVTVFLERPRPSVSYPLSLVVNVPGGAP